MGGLKSPHFHKPILYLSYMKLRPYQAPRRQPKINDMIYPPGSRQGGNVWIGGIMMNVPQPSSGPSVSPTPTPSVTPTMTVTPTPTTTPNALCPQELIISQTTATNSVINGTYQRITNYSGGTFTSAYANSSQQVFIGTAPDGNNYATYGLVSGSTYYLVVKRGDYAPDWMTLKTSGNYYFNGGTPVEGLAITYSSLFDGTIYYPTTGLKSPGFGISYYLSYPISCPTPTPTPTSSLTPTPTSSLTPTPTITPTNTVTPSITPSITPTNTVTPSITPSTSQPASGTTEANAYLSAVVNAGGTGITPTISAATRTLFTSLVSNGLYDKLFALYPMLGGNSAGCKFNGKNPLDTDAAYRITFNGGWTFSSSGATPNGVNSYGNTFLTPSSATTDNNLHLSYYSTTNRFDANTNTIGAESPGEYARLVVGRGGNTGNLFMGRTANGNQTYSLTASTGYFVGNALSTTRSIHRNGVLLTPTSSSSLGVAAKPTVSVYLGANNSNGSAGEFDFKNCAFSTIGQGLTPAEAVTLSSIINTFQTTLGRNTY